ncbi:MAG: hypothetical protein ABI895_19695 [Deltaproteobacteria bacterium]
MHRIKALSAFVAALAAAGALASQAGAVMVCPQNGNEANPTPADNDITIPNPAGLNEASRDCFTGTGWWDGQTRARGSVRRYSDRLQIKAYVFDNVPPPAIQHATATVHGWTGFGVLAGCSATDFTFNHAYGNFQDYPIGSACERVQNFKVIAER